MIKKALLPCLSMLAGMMIGGPGAAAVSASDAAKLGAELTPLGGEKAGNPGFKPGQHYADPYASDKPLYTVTAGNMGQYANKLTEGHKKLLQTYKSSFKMIVYPTHRSAAYPQRIYDATKRIA